MNKSKTKSHKPTTLWGIDYCYFDTVENVVIEESEMIGPFQSYQDAEAWWTKKSLETKDNYNYHQIMPMTPPDAD